MQAHVQRDLPGQRVAPQADDTEGLAMGVLAMIFVLSFLYGFLKEMRTVLLGLVPDATFCASEPLDVWQSV
ncbi:hypothetical protein HKW72_24730, partial [Pseudomonas aeruginosa]|nr:hypothetical protein [Pseudomonas aeruginosa]